ncbi:MAG: glycoside hydrolase family 44 protein [Myxococcaceae bacterium]
MRAPAIAVVLVLVLSPACKRGGSEALAADVPPAKSVPASERKVIAKVFDGGLGEGWMDFGWSERTVVEGAPVRVDMSNYGGWIVAKFGTQPRFGGLVFRINAPESAPIAVFFKADGGDFPKVKLRPDHVYDEKRGWRWYYLRMRELNPDARAFDQLVFLGDTAGSLKDVKIDSVGLTEGNAVAIAGGARAAQGPPVPKSSVVDCTAPSRPISPDIYGIALHVMGFQDKHPFEMGATARRWGGNTMSRYNWKLGNAWNTASDWHFENNNYSGRDDYTYEIFLEENRKHGMRTALTVPTIGWVAKDTTSAGFPKSFYPEQQSVDPDRPEAGNGKCRDGKALPSPPPTTTSIAAPPEFVGEWVKTIRAKDASRGRSVNLYILDNEPMLWFETHRDVHPEPLSYDELLERTIKYGTAVRKADPEGLIAGPAEWGWTNYFHSAVDTTTNIRLRPDRRKHDDLPLIVWYLRKLREHEKKTGVKVLDMVDLHFYPQTEAGLWDQSKTDAKNAALRIRSTRSLWDPTYKDESWVDDTIQLIPRMQGWIRDNYPGLGTVIGEYNFGAENHMSGALAQAEALGRFGQYGLTAAYYWVYPPKSSPVFWAFRAYRNYDGQGGHFLDVSVPTRSEENVSVFASRDPSSQKMVLVALNLDPGRAAKTKIEMKGCGQWNVGRAFSFGGDPKGLTAYEKAKTMSDVLLPPYSITVMELSRASTP